MSVFFTFTSWQRFRRPFFQTHHILLPYFKLMAPIYTRDFKSGINFENYHFPFHPKTTSLFDDASTRSPEDQWSIKRQHTKSPLFGILQFMDFTNFMWIFSCCLRFIFSLRIFLFYKLAITCLTMITFPHHSAKLKTIFLLQFTSKWRTYATTMHTGTWCEYFAEIGIFVPCVVEMMNFFANLIIFLLGPWAFWAASMDVPWFRQ